MNTTQPASTTPPQRDTFSSRKIFILAAIGSAVGLGNIWRFPYVAYEGGGGAFMIPYATALLLAGIPLLLLDYAIGHKYRGGAPLALRRLHPKAEWIGWWMVFVCVIIASYYAVILAWAARYVGFSLDHSWGNNPERFFMDTFVQVAKPNTLSFDFVPGVAIPLIIVWIVVIAIMASGVDKGIGLLSAVFIPLLVSAFALMVAISLTLPGALTGLDAIFTPDWSALTHPKVWMSAVSQIFFSLSVGFGIMITYSSYVDRRTDMTGSGLIVGFANSSFELLAGIGVFAALGFMANASGVPVSQVVSSGIGLAFIAFPTIISQAPFGPLIGVLFFLSLLIAGVTSMVSILEVGVSALREKLGLGRIAGTMLLCLPVATLSIALMGTHTGLPVLDTLDSFVNSFGILLGAMVMMLAITYIFKKLPALRDHLNYHGTFKVNRTWRFLVGVVVPLTLAYLLITDVATQLAKPYGDYPQWFVNTFGWGMTVLLPVLGITVSLLPWKQPATLDAEHAHEDYEEGLTAAYTTTAEENH
ncbi:Na+-dependent transporters of the SNF family [Dermatophilus congolensis]|uniref:Na+-dependent transporters of the SNF family n=1 Tax=Dermatophilus congolensis TaxID=1863 RepID=A0AA46BLQ2_9MICO|nr:sodium-dependent transporter [Dermatophilus congolensis]STD05099.1 Na+-dependent transporters of the SNF family [Dermatophilus congolensis]